MFKLNPFFEEILREVFKENPFILESKDSCEKCSKLQSEIKKHPYYEEDGCGNYNLISKSMKEHLVIVYDDYGASQHQSNQEYLCNDCHSLYHIYFEIGSDYHEISFKKPDISKKSGFSILRKVNSQIYFKEFVRKFEEKIKGNEGVIKVYALLQPNLKRANHDYLLERGNTEEDLKELNVHESLGSFLKTSNYIGGAFTNQTLLELSVQIQDLEYELGEFIDHFDLLINADKVLDVKVFDPFNQEFVDKDSINWQSEEYIEKLKSLYTFTFNKYSGMSEIDIKINLYLNKIYSEMFYEDALESSNFKRNFEKAFEKIRESKEIKELKENLKIQMNNSQNK